MYMLEQNDPFNAELPTSLANTYFPFHKQCEFEKILSFYNVFWTGAVERNWEFLNFFVVICKKNLKFMRFPQIVACYEISPSFGLISIVFWQGLEHINRTKRDFLIDFHELSIGLAGGACWLSGTNLGVPSEQFYWNNNGVNIAKGYVNWKKGYPEKTCGKCLNIGYNGKWQSWSCSASSVIENVLCELVLWISIILYQHLNPLLRSSTHWVSSNCHIWPTAWHIDGNDPRTIAGLIVHIYRETL